MHVIHIACCGGTDAQGLRTLAILGKVAFATTLVTDDSLCTLSKPMAGLPALVTSDSYLALPRLRQQCRSCLHHSKTRAHRLTM